TLTSELLTASVMSVPPLARAADGSLAAAENAKVIKHIEAGGLRSLLYGGNANFYHLPLSELDAVLTHLAETAGPDTLVIPSAGPAFGLAMDQAKVYRKHKFPTVMLLPQVGITTSKGVAEGVRRFADAVGVPVLLYVKHDGYIEPADVKPLADQKVISGIKYATVRDDAATKADPYLHRLLDVVDRKLVISGIGEQPAVVHLRDFSLGGFTTGCGCVAPRLSGKMLAALRKKDYAEAERIRGIFRPLEDLRNAINPIRVLHEAVRLAGIAETGPLQPLMTNVEEKDHAGIREAASKLLAADKAA
ncbi:MAG: 5-dehydro-4-deoxyglucarate dehydratase, partial [Phycisphaerales bacterium]|nr:5-dehydro-4-deoxyglucarate dehydratase [Phycisphaerales bacterium]